MHSKFMGKSEMARQVIPIHPVQANTITSIFERHCSGHWCTPGQEMDRPHKHRIRAQSVDRVPMNPVEYAKETQPETTFFRDHGRLILRLSTNGRNFSNPSRRRRLQLVQMEASASVRAAWRSRGYQGFRTFGCC